MKTLEMYRAGGFTKKETLEMYRFGACPECDYYYTWMHHPGGEHWAYCLLHDTKTRIPLEVWEHYCTERQINPDMNNHDSPTWLNGYREVPFYLPVWVAELRKGRKVSRRTQQLDLI